MPAVEITNFQKFSIGGLAPTTITPTATDGNFFYGTGTEMIWVNNGGVGSINVTIKRTGTCNYGLANNAAHDKVVAVANGAVKVIGPVDETFKDANGKVTFICSDVTSVGVAVVRA